MPALHLFELFLKLNSLLLVAKHKMLINVGCFYVLFLLKTLVWHNEHNKNGETETLMRETPESVDEDTFGKDKTFVEWYLFKFWLMGGFPSSPPIKGNPDINTVHSDLDNLMQSFDLTTLINMHKLVTSHIV